MKKIKGRKFSKRLAGAITLALLAAQAGSALAADTYNKQIIESNYAGSVLRTYWQNEGISDGKHNYTFKDDATLSVNLTNQEDLSYQQWLWNVSAIGVSGYNDTNIDMQGHKLSIDMSGDKYDSVNLNIRPILVNSNTLTMKNVNGIDIYVHDSKKAYTTAIQVSGDASRGAYQDGEGNSVLKIENDNDPNHAVKIRTDENVYFSQGVFVNSNSGTAKLDIKGLVDIDLRKNLYKPTGILAFGDSKRGDYAETSIGGGKIIVADSGNAVYSYDSYITINSALDDSKEIIAKDVKNDVEINGRIRSAGANGIVAIALNTDKSSWTGSVVQEPEGSPAGSVQLILSDKAKWNATGASAITRFAGGSSYDDAGSIFQKAQAGDLNIANYSGYTNVFYEHSNSGTAADDYTAGDVIIKNANKGSGISMITDSSNITMSDEAQVKDVLNTLASKLTYSAYVDGEHNLRGIVKIADGLLTSSAELKTGSIAFSETDGKGSYGGDVSDVVNPKTDFTTTITGTDADTEYSENDIVQKDGTYKFAEETTITPAANVQAINVSKDTVIDASGRTLQITTKDATNQINAVEAASGKKLELTAKKVSIDVTGSSRTEGVHLYNSSATVNGDLDITSKGIGYALGSYIYGDSTLTVNGDLSINVDGDNSGWGYYGASGLYVAGQLNTANSIGGQAIVNGDVDISGKGNGIFANIGNALVTINGGGTIDVDSSVNNYAAIRAENSTVNMNVKLDDNGKAIEGAGNDVTINGNIAVSTGAVNPIDIKGTLSRINLALDTKYSTLNGVVINGFPVDGKTTGGVTFTGENNLWLQNGAVWTNEKNGIVDSKFSGSYVNNFVGGSTAESAGNIFQKDSNNITFANYSGNTNIYYTHNNSGTEAKDYEAGDTIIKGAAKGSSINLITDNSNITMNKDKETNAVLDALAGKLYYNAYADGERNLSGTVTIADGLTTSSATLKSGDITFTNEKGQGSYVVPEKAAYEFVTTLTGTESNDQEYIDLNLRQEDGSYKFDKDVTIDIGANKANKAIKADDDLVVDAKDKVINIVGNQVATYGTLYGVLSQMVNTTINAKEINIDITTKDGDVHCLEAQNIKYADKQSKLTVNSDVNIKNAQGAFAVYGIYSRGNSALEINGDVTMKNEEGGYGLVPTQSYSSPRALYATGTTYGPAYITVNGDTDIVVDGNGVGAENYGSEVNLNGAVKIKTNPGRSNKYAVSAGGGTVNVNNGEQAKDIQIDGNIGLLKSDLGASIININMNTADSYLNGVIYDEATNEKSELNFTLQNGAVWTNKLYNTNSNFAGSTVRKIVGGSSATSAGNIFQNDTNKINITNYSGNTNIFYAHENKGTSADDYIAGDTIIGNAAVGSNVSLITDNTNINTVRLNEVNQVLNALAGKLTYSAYVDGERNLNGKVIIADGLLTSSMTLNTGDITFNTETGKGSYEAPATEPTTEFTTPVTGNRETDWEYDDAGVIKEDNVYKFDKDSSITVSGGTAADLNSVSTIDAVAKTLVIDNTSTGGTNIGLNKTEDGRSSVVAKKLKISVVNESGRAEGIHLASSNSNGRPELVIDGDVELNTEGTDNTIGAYVMGNSKLTVNGDLKAHIDGHNGGYSYYGSEILYATSNMGANSMGSELTVDGNVDLSGVGNGIFANAGGSVITVTGGGKIDVDSSTNPYAAIRAEDGTVNMNVVSDDNGKAIASGKENVNIKGNIAATTGAVNRVDKNGTLTQINLGLATKESSLTGAVYNAFPEEGTTSGDLTFTGEVNMWLQNGATWNNQVQGQIGSSSGGKSFEGSIVSNLVGGDSADKAGNIFQSDANKLTIRKYSGFTNLYYAHDNAGASAEDYKAGDTVIQSASSGSGVNLITGNNGIDLTSKSEVEEALSALARKLTYSGYAAGEKNLTGKVGIADGLTTSSAMRKLGDMSFASTDGKGSYVAGSVSNVDGNDFQKPIIKGDYENAILKGVRSAMMTSALDWRDNAANLNGRSLALREGAEAGAWVQTYGGKMKYDNDALDFTHQYWAGQAGFDKAIANGWNLGAAIDYRDGSASYLNGDKGDTKLYSLGVYASKNVGNNAYVDLMAKAGKVKNEFTVYNDFRNTPVEVKADGEYSATGYSVSVQYGQRFGNTKKGYLEPQLQLTYAHLGSDSFAADSKAGKLFVNQEAFDSLVGRIGVQTGIENERGGFYAKLSLAHEFSGDAGATYISTEKGAEAKHTSYDLGGTWSELTVGGSYNLSKCSNFYADVTRSLTGDYQHQWKLNAGINFSF